jgi:hypothetical protein
MFLESGHLEDQEGDGKNIEMDLRERDFDDLK